MPRFGYVADVQQQQRVLDVGAARSNGPVMASGYQWGDPLDTDNPPLCACGCGEPVTRVGRKWNTWRKGHHRRKHQNPDGSYDLASAKANERLVRVYGITRNEYEEMLEDQGGVCAVCGVDDPGRGDELFCVDHDHGTGAVRGLLCHPCNAALGLLNDDPERVDAAASYLRRWAN